MNSVMGTSDFEVWPSEIRLCGQFNTSLWMMSFSVFNFTAETHSQTLVVPDTDLSLDVLDSVTTKQIQIIPYC